MSQNITIMNQTPPVVYCGLDISKASLQLDFNHRIHEAPNTAPGHKNLVKLLYSVPAIHVICEATGGYERAIVTALQEASIPVSVINPARVRHFARAQGRLAKTDPIDTAVLSAYGTAFKPAATPVASATQKRLVELTARRAQLMDLIVMEKNRAPMHQLREVAKLARQLLRQLEAQIEQIDKLLEQLLQEDGILAQRAQRLDAIAGVGLLTAVTVLAQMPELGTLNRREAAALAGLAPINRDSGAWNGPRSISGGRASVRKTLYMAALTASQYNKHLKLFYQRLKEAGKPSKLALTAVMRKLIILMNHILKNPNFVLAD